MSIVSKIVIVMVYTVTALWLIILGTNRFWKIDWNDDVIFEKEIESDDFIIEKIKHGYTIPIYDTQPPCILNIKSSSLLESDFVYEIINDLLLKGLIEICDNSWCTNTLNANRINSVVRKEKKHLH